MSPENPPNGKATRGPRPINCDEVLDAAQHRELQGPAQDAAELITEVLTVVRDHTLTEFTPSVLSAAAAIAAHRGEDELAATFVGAARPIDERPLGAFEQPL